MDGFDAGHIRNHTDSQGRYAWNVQPAVAHWNLVRLAEALRPLISSPEPLRDALDTYEANFLGAFTAAMQAKLGLELQVPGDDELVDEFWQLLYSQRADFTLAFRRLAWADLPQQGLHADAA